MDVRLKKNLIFTLSVHNLFGQKPKWAERLLFKIFFRALFKKCGEN